MFFFGLLLLLHPTTNILDRKENLKKFRIGSELIRRKKPEETKHHKKFGQNPAKHQTELIQNQASTSISHQSPSRTNTHRKSTTN